MVKKIIRKVAVSTGESVQLKMYGIKKKIIYSFFPCDHYDCECQNEISALKNKFSSMNPKEASDLKLKMEYLRCPRDKAGMSKYRIFCNNCGALVGECYATDETLLNYCDLHYISEHDGKFWRGAFGINISPVDGKLGIECTCGSDTRDFRANTTYPDKFRQEKIKETSKGRIFGEPDSKFIAKKVD